MSTLLDFVLLVALARSSARRTNTARTELNRAARAAFRAVSAARG